MDESVEGISVIENVLATPGSNTYVTKGVMNQAVQGSCVIENFDEDVVEIKSVPNTEAVFEKVDITTQDITMTENLVNTPGPSAEGIGESVDQLAEVKTENREASFIPNTEGTPEIVDQEGEGINAIRNLVATPGQSVEGVSEAMDQTTEDFRVTENLKATPVSVTEVFTEIIDLYEVNETESFVTVPGSSSEGIDEIIDQTTEHISVMENIEAISIPNTERIEEINDKTAEGFGVNENLEATPGPSAEGIGEIVNQIAEVKIENREATFIPNTEGSPEIVDQEGEGINAIRNLVATPGQSVEGVSEAMDQTTENFRVTENLKATPVSVTEVFTEIMDLYEVSETESLVTVAGSTPEGIGEIIDQTTEDINLMENIEAISIPNSERIGEINDKIAEGFGVNENLEATPVSSKGVNETHVKNVNTTDIVFDDKEMSNTENEAENEASNTTNSAAGNLKIVCGRKSKGLKRKISHPSISEMLMGCIKSLKKSSGVSFEDIKTRMEENYSVKVKALLKYHVINYLQKWVEIGILEKVKEADLEERFRIKESEISYENDCIIQAKKLKID